ncbi:hypothetical protein [Chryseobacterium capnotolerans]|uniref:hypothetical protein n=1 Tax=Chryseobacterium capnotolerans TaxID=2759528 RepID=UPI001E2F88F2|nr:hypothetical protein [Chryseobacterium capnotolerans]
MKKSNNRKRYKLEVSKSIFDDDLKLKFIKKPEWNDEFVLHQEEEEDDDEFPF